MTWTIIPDDIIFLLTYTNAKSLRYNTVREIGQRLTKRAGSKTEKPSYYHRAVNLYHNRQKSQRLTE